MMSMVAQVDKLVYRDPSIYAGLARCREFPSLGDLLAAAGGVMMGALCLHIYRLMIRGR